MKRVQDAQVKAVPSAPGKQKLRRGLWSPDEDERLMAYISNHGMQGYSWTYVAKQAGLQRCGKSCRLRWINYLRPDIKRGGFSRQEEQLIIYLQSIQGNRWAQIASRLPGRTDNEIKNYWNTHIKKHKRKLKQCPSSNNTKSNILPRRTDTNTVTRTPIFPFNLVPTEDTQSQFAADSDFTNNNLISQFSDSAKSYIYQTVSSEAVVLTPSQGLHNYNTAKSWVCNEIINESCRTLVLPHEDLSPRDYSIGSAGITMTAVAESDRTKGSTENGGAVNDNQVMINFISFTDASCGITSAWSISHSYSNDDDRLSGISVVEDSGNFHHHGKAAHQSCPPLISVSGSPFSASTTRSAADQSNHLHAVNDWKDRQNLMDDVNLRIPTHIDMNGKQQCHGQIEGGRVGVPDQLSCSEISNEGANEFEYDEFEAEQIIKAWAEDDYMYNIHMSACSELDQIHFTY
eukprot:PITA_09111